MKSLSLFILSLLSSSFAVASQPACPQLNLAGVWENGWGIRFRVYQDNCNEVIIHQEGKLENFYLQLDGKTVMPVKGNSIENLPRLVKYSEASGGWENRTIKPLVEKIDVLASLGSNPLADKYDDYSKGRASVNFTASILLPKDNKGKNFFPIKASMLATITIQSFLDQNHQTQDRIYIGLHDPKVVSVGRGEPGIFAKGFMKGINALLSLQSFSYFNQDGESAYFTGPRVFRELVDWKSRSLKRIH